MNGFARYAVAPCCLASLRIAIESWAVMMIIGVSEPRARNSVSNSKPDIAGNLISLMMHSALPMPPPASNASADA